MSRDRDFVGMDEDLKLIMGNLMETERERGRTVNADLPV